MDEVNDVSAVAPDFHLDVEGEDTPGYSNRFDTPGYNINRYSPDINLNLPLTQNKQEEFY